MRWIVCSSILFLSSPALAWSRHKAARVSCVKIILTENHWSLAAAWAGLGWAAYWWRWRLSSPPPDQSPINTIWTLPTWLLVPTFAITANWSLKDIWFWYQVISNTWGHKVTWRCFLPIAILTMPPVLLGVRVLHETLVRTLAPFCLSTTWQLKKCRKGSNYSGHTRKKFLLSIEECDLFK